MVLRVDDVICNKKKNVNGKQRFQEAEETWYGERKDTKSKIYP